MKSCNSLCLKNIYAILIAYICAFIFLFLYYSLEGYKENIPSFMIGIHVYFAIAYFTCIMLSLFTKNSVILYLVIFLYSLFSSILVRSCSWIYLNEPFFHAVDSYTYDSLATMSLCSGDSYINYLLLLFLSGLNVDDVGMTSIVYFIYKLFGVGDNGQTALLLLNSLILLLSSIKINKIMMLYSIQHMTRFFCLMVFGCFPFLSVIAAVGLKENFFVFLIVSAFYYMLHYKYTGSRNDLLLFFLFCFFALLFRKAIFAILLIVLFLFLIAENCNKKKLLYMILLGSVVGVLLLNVILIAIFDKPLEQILATSGARSESVSMNETLKWTTQVIAVLFGPFPSMNRTIQYGLIHSSGLLLKMFLNFFMIASLIDIIRTYDYMKYPLLVYFLTSAMMFILSFVALDMRYQITLFPLMIPLIAYAIQNIRLRSGLFFMYSLFVIGLVFFYNNR